MEKTITVLISCYWGTDPNLLSAALQSINNQTQSFSELLVVLDGPVSKKTESTLTELQKCSTEFIVTLLRLPKNRGLGAALAYGVLKAKGDWLLRMDDDDYSYPERLENQLNFIAENPDVDLCGCNIQEISRNGMLLGIRKCPQRHKDIERIMKSMNSMNHVTVLVRKEAILSAGNYSSDYEGYEDYELWVRMLLNGATFSNLDKVFVDVLFDKGQMARRQGIRALMKELRFQRHIHTLGFTSTSSLLTNIVTRCLCRLIPARLLLALIMTFTRTQKK